MDKNQQYILINRFLTGDISESENNQLQQWLQKSTDNQKIFYEVEKLWHNINTPQPETIPPFEKFWQKLNNQLEISGRTQKATIFSLKKASHKTNIFSLFGGQIRIGAMAAAAALILLIGGFVLYQKIFKTTNFLIYATQNSERIERTLPDGSIVFLNSDSEIKFAKNFLDSVRTIQLAGQAFFEVIADGRQFIVNTKNARVRVMGTSFDVRARYQQTRVIVKQGKVALLSAELPSDSGVLLAANEMSVCREKLPPELPRSVDVNQILGWMQGKLVFDATPLSDVVNELIRFYDKKITIASPELEQLELSGEFADQSIDEVLSTICLTLDLQFKVEKQRYIISK